jgi:hypothetical protein
MSAITMVMTAPGRSSRHRDGSPVAVTDVSRTVAGGGAGSGGGGAGSVAGGAAGAEVVGGGSAGAISASGATVDELITTAVVVGCAVPVNRNGPTPVDGELSDTARVALRTNSEPAVSVSTMAAAQATRPRPPGGARIAFRPPPSRWNGSPYRMTYQPESAP